MTAILVVVAAFSPATAGAAITASMDEVHVGAPPASVALNQHQHDDDTGNPRGAHAFDEEQDHTTTTPISLDICIPGSPSFASCEPNARAGRFDRSTDFPTRGGTIPAGTCIDSHFVHADPTGTGRTVYDGQVRFASRILGVIVSTPRLAASDADPGLAPTTTYGAEPTRGLEFGPTGQLDWVSIEADATRLVFHLDVNQPGGDLLDQIRVITIGDAQSCPGQATQLTLTPELAANPVNTQHCVVASVKNATGGPAAGVIVRFDVEGASEEDTSPADEDASRTTDQNGQAMHCYQGPETVGTDTIHAYADNDRDNEQDAIVEPFDDATKTWLPGSANRLTLEPKADENPVDTEHCVVATVEDVFFNPVPGVRVRFVVTGTVEKQHVEQTNTAGEADFCYTSTKAGADVIVAHVDETNRGTQDIGEPADVAGKTWQPGEPAEVVLHPKVAENEVDDEHCVDATVYDVFGNRVPNVRVRFVVVHVAVLETVGTVTKTGTDSTENDGDPAVFCYVFTSSGEDAIVAHVDDENRGVQDPAEPFDPGTKTWLPAEPAFLTLTPEADQNIVGEQHCLQAYVTDIFLNPNPDEPVRFVVTGTTQKQATQRTNAAGIAEFCYTSTKSGLDAIHAWADTIEEDNEQDPGEPFHDATKLWHPGDPAFLDLKPETDSNEVETEHCVKAEVRDAFGNPTPKETVRFDVEGASEQDQDPADEDGSATTDEFGNAEHCYTGPELPGTDAIHAYADNDEDNVEDADEPARDDAAKTWILPPSTPGCEITIHNGGWIFTLTGSKGSFGGNARIEADGTITRGEQTYHDHSALMPITFKSTEVLVIVCDPDEDRADIYGLGEVNGLPPVHYRIRVRDLGEPGSAPGPDTYQIITAAYVSGLEDNPLQGGNIQVHVFG
ncbi:MAG TPA: Ig-like domain-containing protein [Gaiellaceae bacterium]|nr:Ig-like domain-containing protein [Gaiellaceae bacterium]